MSFFPCHLFCSNLSPFPLSHSCTLNFTIFIHFQVLLIYLWTEVKPQFARKFFCTHLIWYHITLASFPMGPDKTINLVCVYVCLWRHECTYCEHTRIICFCSFRLMAFSSTHLLVLVFLSLTVCVCLWSSGWCKGLAGVKLQLCTAYIVSLSDQRWSQGRVPFHNF